MILRLQFSRNNYKEIYSKIKYTWWHNMLWRLRRWKISISGGSQAGNWWLPRRIIFRYWYISHFCTLLSSVGLEDCLGHAAALKEGQAEQDCISHTGPDGGNRILVGGDVLHQDRVDCHADHDEERLKA